MPNSKQTDVKTAAREAIDQLPDDATWDDVMYRLYVRQKIDAGLRDVENGRTVTTTEVRRRFGLTDERWLDQGRTLGPGSNSCIHCSRLTALRHGCRRLLDCSVYSNFRISLLWRNGARVPTRGHSGGDRVFLKQKSGRGDPCGPPSPHHLTRGSASGGSARRSKFSPELRWCRFWGPPGRCWPRWGMSVIGRTENHQVTHLGLTSQASAVAISSL